MGADLGEQLGRCSVGLGCFHRASPLFPARSGAVVVRALSSTGWGHLPPLRPVALHQRSDSCVVSVAVELGHEIVRTQLVEISPPSTSPVVPDPVTTRHAPGDVASPAHGPRSRHNPVPSFSDSLPTRDPTRAVVNGRGTMQLLTHTLSNCGGGVVGVVRGRSPGFVGGWRPRRARLRVSSERP